MFNMFSPSSIKMIKELIFSSINSEKTIEGKCIVSTIYIVIFVTWIKWFDYIIFHYVAAKITEKKLVIFELKDIFYHSIDDEATNKGHIEKMGADVDYTIEKKLFWIHPHAKSFFEMCFKNESLDIAIWTTALKQSTTIFLKKFVSETIQDKLVFN